MVKPVEVLCRHLFTICITGIYLFFLLFDFPVDEAAVDPECGFLGFEFQ